MGPVSSGIPFGFGMVVIYFSANAYIIDAFPGYVASALAAKTVIRSGSGAAMPLFITAMFHNLGNGWAASTWAFISLAMVSRAIMILYMSLKLTSFARSARFLSSSTDTESSSGRSQNVLPRHRILNFRFLITTLRHIHTHGQYAFLAIALRYATK